ncbi:MAG: hypothetical protein Ct9H90mP13_13570 [Pseudomonadota bacterium]|nr:MAG: hypothetical protein Ct9H90mP13_13570 [Pseudomonadota bacterium]
MIGKLNHIAIAVPDLESASKIYRDTLGANVSEPVPMPEHGVTTVFIELPNTKIELLEPLGDDSPIQNYLLKNPKGGMHHICYEVDDIYASRDKLIADGAKFWVAVSHRSELMISLFYFFIPKISAGR